MGWKFIEGRYYYYENNQPVKGWKYFTEKDGEKTPHWSFFDLKTGQLYTGWHWMTSAEGEKTPHWSYFGSNGWLRTGWYYFTTKNDKEPTDHWSYFGANGWLRTGWVKFGKGTSEPDGDSKPHWSYFGDNGWLYTGLVSLGAADKETPHLSFFDDKGWLVTNSTVIVDGKTYKADGKGWLTLVKTDPTPPVNVMTQTKFLAWANGKYLDYDGVYGVQCVDLIKYDLDKVFNIKPGAWGNAHAYYDNFYDHPELVKTFDRIANTPDFVPKKGDIVVWKKALNGAYGHIAIADGVGNTDYFYSYDQNWTGHNDKCTRIYHSYKYVAGVLRPKDKSKI